MNELNTDNALEIARRSILAPSGLDDGDLNHLLSGILGHEVDSADLYFQASHQESWSLEDGIVKDGSHSIEQGVGVRAVAGERTGFAYSDDIVLPALTQASEAARAIARRGRSGAVQAWAAPPGRQLYLPLDPLETLSDADKVKFLESIDARTRTLDPRIKQVMVSLSGEHEVVLVVGSDGTFAADVRPLVRCNVSVIVEQNGRREQGYAGGGGRFGYDYFLSEDRAFGFAREAV